MRFLGRAAILLLPAATAPCAQAEQDFKDNLEKLQARYEGLVKTKDETIAALQPELRMFRAAAKGDKDEL